MKCAYVTVFPLHMLYEVFMSCEGVTLIICMVALMGIKLKYITVCTYMTHVCDHFSAATSSVLFL